MTMIKRVFSRIRSEVRSRRFAAASHDARLVPTILCPSIGRVGSTMLYDSLIKGRAQYLLGSFIPSDRNAIKSTCWDLKTGRPRPATICKTHDLPYDLDPNVPLKIVFLYGTPSDAVLSVLRRAAAKEGWGRRHLQHMHALGELSEVADRDVLRLEEQIDAWMSTRIFPMLAIRYDALWVHRDVIERFVGFPVPLPPKSTRSFDDLDPTLVSRVRAFYSRLDSKAALLPDYFEAGRA